MTNRINAGERELQKLIEGRHISPSGADWVVIAADPFHDKPLPNLCGYPQEGVNGQSIVLKVPYQMNITAPPGIAPGMTWDFMVNTYPWLDGQAPGVPGILVPWQAYGNLLGPTGTSPTSNAASSVSVYSGPTGNNLGPFDVGLLGNNPLVPGISLENAYTRGPHRLIGWGLEIYDTTAVIDRQGTCTVFRQNVNTCDKTAWLVTGTNATPGANEGVFSGVIMRRPPRNISEANKLAGTKSWKSEDGCYLVCTMNSNDITIKQADDAQPVIFFADVQAGSRIAGGSSQVLSGSFIPQSLPTAPAPIVKYFPQTLFDFQPFNMSGAFFTGLKPGASFLLRTVFYVERFPSPDENDIVLVTKPSASYDPLALEIYDHMLHRMPVGVPVADNGLGEWFWEGIKSAASFFLPKIGGFLAPKQVNSTAPIATRKQLPSTKANKMTPSSPPIRRPKPLAPVKKKLTPGEQLRLIKEKKRRGDSLSKVELRFLESHN
nr:MAG: hypothetical protein H2BulkLitter12255_000003 [Astroviridae sp.]